MFYIIVSIAIVLLTLKFIYRIIFPKNERFNTDSGYTEKWYGRGSPTDDTSAKDTSIRPFKINVPDQVLDDLKSRLERTRFEDPVEGSKFHYGFNPNYLRTLVEYWKTEYDWRKQEEFLNQFPQFKTRIEGIDVHFLHVKPSIPEGQKLQVIPLMIVHGWPGSIVEFYKIIPLLTTARTGCNFVFEVVCPSIPGFGFSESPHQQGFNARAAARVFTTLMERLGHNKFYVQGGDWGSAIVSLMARYYPKRVLGLHVNMYFFILKSWDFVKFLLVAAFPFLVSPEEYKTMFPLKKRFKEILQESGYFHMQTTKPDTLGCAMSDSPAGMAAYLLEKFPSATYKDCLQLEDGGMTRKFTLDELLTNVMVYWVNNNFTAAARFYKENVKPVFSGRHERIPVKVPSAVAVFPNEVLMCPKMLMSQQMKNLVSYTIMPRGGHFAALEEPQLLADDIWQFVGIVTKKHP